jgi:hypothetical protein
LFGDSNGNLFIADFWNIRVRLISTSSGLITTFAGTGQNSGPEDGDGGKVLISLQI